MNVRNQKYLDAFGEHLQKMMDARDMNAADVAAGTDLEPKHVYRVVHGEHSTTLSVIYLIAQGLDTHPKNLFDFDFTETE